VPLLSLEDRVRKQVETAGRSLLDQLREAVEPRAKGRAKMSISELNDKHLLEIYFWMCEGKTDHWVAKRIKSWGYSPERDLSNWRKMVRTFRDRAVPQLKDIAAVRDKKTREQLYHQRKRARKVAEKVDALQIMHETLALQKERAEMMLGLEKELLLPTEFDDVPTDIKDLYVSMRKSWAEYFGPEAVNESLNALVRTADKVLDQERKLGIRDNAPSEATIHIQHQFQGFLEHTLTDGGHMLTAGVHNMFQKMEEEALTLKIDDGGNWSLEDGDGSGIKRGTLAARDDNLRVEGDGEAGGGLAGDPFLEATSGGDECEDTEKDEDPDNY